MYCFLVHLYFKNLFYLKFLYASFFNILIFYFFFLVIIKFFRFVTYNEKYNLLWHIKIFNYIFVSILKNIFL